MSSLIKANIIQPYSSSSLIIRSWDGWIDADETWTYASADAPTYTFTVSGNKTTKYSVGMKIKLLQNGVTKYFIITAIIYTSPLTTITVYGGTDYILTATDTITNPFYSTQRSPLGFPMNSAKWTVELINNVQYNTTSTTYTNILSITLPIGLWDVSLQAGIEDSSTYGYITLATSNNSESDNELTALFLGGGGSIRIEKTLSIASKTLYYLNIKTGNSSYTMYVLGSAVKTIIRASCAYL